MGDAAALLVLLVFAQNGVWSDRAAPSTSVTPMADVRACMDTAVAIQENLKEAGQRVLVRCYSLSHPR